jgi:hypothetical protein
LQQQVFFEIPIVVPLDAAIMVSHSVTRAWMQWFLCLSLENLTAMAQSACATLNTRCICTTAIVSESNSCLLTYLITPHEWRIEKDIEGSGRCLF